MCGRIVARSKRDDARALPYSIIHSSVAFANISTDTQTNIRWFRTEFLAAKFNMFAMKNIYRHKHATHTNVVLFFCLRNNSDPKAIFVSAMHKEVNVMKEGSEKCLSSCLQSFARAV